MMSFPQPTAQLLVDTNALIEELRDKPDAMAISKGYPQTLALAAVSVAELYVDVLVPYTTP